MTIKIKLLGGGLTISVILIAVLGLTVFTFKNLSNGFTDIVARSDTGVSNARSTESSISSADQSLSEVSKGILEIVDDINKTNMTIKILERKIKTLAETQAELAESLNDVVDEMPDGEARYTLEDAVDAVGDIEETMRREALISLTSTVTKMDKFTENISARVDDIKNLTKELNEGKSRSTEVVTANEGIRQLSINFGENIAVSRNVIALVLSVIIVLTIVSVFLLTRSITRPLSRSIQIANGIASGDLNQKVDIQGKDELGQLGQAMSTMIDNLKEDIQQTRKRAEEATRIRLALDVGRTNVLMADADQKIIYMNESAKNTLQEVEQDIQSVLTDFNVENLPGSDICALHLNPDKRREIIRHLDQEQREDIELGGRHLRTYTNPVFSEHGERLGISMEFADRSKEISIEKEVEHITSLANKGDLTQRLQLSDKEGFFLILGENMNHLLDTVSDALNDIALTMGTMSKGDLTQKIDKQYDGTYAKVKDAVNSTIDSLREIVTEVHESSDIIGVATGEVIQGNNNMSKRTEQQASDLEQIASSTEELTSTVQSNSDNSQTANTLAGDARKQAENGGQVVGEAISAMTDIRDSSQKISEIIGVINEIAFQTNLLALNASVEAARAGEQGRGFAVVATEVRNLAQRSAGAAKEIKELIIDSEGKVKNGVELVNRSGQTLDSITIAVQKVGDIISEIAASSIEQTRGLEQINITMRSMDESTQQNAALAEETSAASLSMGEQVSKMENSLKFFDL